MVEILNNQINNLIRRIRKFIDGEQMEEPKELLEYVIKLFEHQANEVRELKLKVYTMDSEYKLEFEKINKNVSELQEFKQYTLHKMQIHDQQFKDIYTVLHMKNPQQQDQYQNIKNTPIFGKKLSSPYQFQYMQKQQGDLCKLEEMLEESDYNSNTNIIIENLQQQQFQNNLNLQNNYQQRQQIFNEKVNI